MKHIIAGNAQTKWMLSPESCVVDSFGLWHERFFTVLLLAVFLSREEQEVCDSFCANGAWSMLAPLFLSGRWPGEWPGLLRLLFSFDGVENALGVLGVLIRIKVIMESSMYGKVLCPTTCFVCVSLIVGQYAVLFNRIQSNIAEEIAEWL